MMKRGGSIFSDRNVQRNAQNRHNTVHLGSFDSVSKIHKLMNRNRGFVDALFVCV